MTHPAFVAGGTAVITGGASGIGLAAAKEVARRGMRAVLLDLSDEALAEAKAAVEAEGGPEVVVRRVDVRDKYALEGLAEEFPAEVVMANAGVQPESDCFGPPASWDRIIGVNLWGVIHVAQAWGPRMVARQRPGAIICTGSKQGITTPPGNPAYNVSKAGVKVFAEALAHQLRETKGCAVTAHLLIPGFVFTPLTRPGESEKPAGAWTADQTVGFMMERLGKGDFYILCPDNDVPRALDEKRIAWAAGDIIENRPPLSRWHPDWAEKFAAYLKG